MAFKSVWAKHGQGFILDRTYTDFYADQVAEEKTKKYGNLHISVPKGMLPETYIYKNRKDLIHHIKIITI